MLRNKGIAGVQLIFGKRQASKKQNEGNHEGILLLMEFAFWVRVEGRGSYVEGRG